VAVLGQLKLAFHSLFSLAYLS